MNSTLPLPPSEGGDEFDKSADLQPTRPNATAPDSQELSEQATTGTETGETSPDSRFVGETSPTDTSAPSLTTIAGGAWAANGGPGGAAMSFPPADHADSSDAAGDMERVKALFGSLRPNLNNESIGSLGNYEIVRILGSGAFGAVALAYDPVLTRSVAIKVLKPEMSSVAEVRKRFAREARTAASISHPNVVRIYGVEEASVPYLVMEYVSGSNLRELIDSKGRLPFDKVAAIGRQLASALAAAHAKGVIHRDVKPDNILVSDEEESRVLVTDFGIARAMDDATLTKSGSLIGTPMYMSPEQASGSRVDHRSDLFSLGGVLYFLVSGKPPFPASSLFAVMLRVVNGPPDPFSDEVLRQTPKWFLALMERLLAKSPDQRVQSARDVVQEIDACCAIKPLGSQSSAQDLSLKVVKADPSRAERVEKHSWLKLVVLTLAVTVIVGFTVHYAADLDTSRLQYWYENAMSGKSAPGNVSKLRPVDSVVPAYLGQVPGETRLIGSSVPMKFCWCPAGTFRMGTSRGATRSLAEPEVFAQVTIANGFWIGQTEVTQKTWSRIMSTHPWTSLISTAPEEREGTARNYVVIGDDYPASFVTWKDANAFCAALTEREIASGNLPHGLCYRLPTEAEWEYACRATSQSDYCYGSNYSLLSQFAWWGAFEDGSAAGSPHPQRVGQRSPNRWDVHDMHGNVWEWCWDWYAHSLPGGIDPSGPRTGAGRVFRGGAWNSPSSWCRCDRRSGQAPEKGTDHVGFRVVVGRPLKSSH